MLAQYERGINFFRGHALPSWCTGHTMRVVVTGLVVVMGGAYVFETSAATVNGYEIHSLEKKIARLKADVKSLEIEAVSYQSLASVEKRLSVAGMVPADNVAYVNIASQPSIARR